jgi:hypothetical protein
LSKGLSKPALSLSDGGLSKGAAFHNSHSQTYYPVKEKPMEPTTLILTALAAGAAAAAKDTASQAIKDGYAGLKSLVQKRFAGKPEAEMALTQHEKKPEVWEAPLKEALAETGSDQDKEILQKAQTLMQLIQPQQASQGKYNIQIGQAKGTVIGDNAQVTQNFDKE